MSAGLIIAIVIAVLILLALFIWLGRRNRERKHETRRHEAREIRREAEVRGAEAEERAARARREEAQARQQAAQADDRRRVAEEHHARAHDVDPDTKGDYEPGMERTTTREADFDTDRTDESGVTRERPDTEVVRDEQRRTEERTEPR